MGKLIKKGTEGESTKYFTKGKAMRKLQLNTQQFHRLCILKGVYPRDPKKKKDPSKTYYHIKDVKFLAHEGLLEKFREIDAWLLKLRKAKIRKDVLKAEKISENIPKYSLTHLVKERYPRFIDALHDLDDALSLICLFASCPSNADLKISNESTLLSQKLWNEFELYLVASRAVRKSFLSIKGIYYQAEVKGQLITWLVPYQFTQHLPFDVDYSIMSTFLEFYHTLMRFVNYKLYAELSMPYPPNLAIPVDRLLSTVVPPAEFQFDPTFANDPEVQKIAQQQKENDKIKNLFKGFTFCLGRETPKYSLEMIIRSCGGKIEDENSPNITHHIVDRPLSIVSETREYLQPQWVYDSLNFCILLPLAQYRPNLQLPPHLSPFVDYKSEGYVPDRFREILSFKGENLTESKKLEKERKQLGKIMMTRKIRGLYNKMKVTNRRKKEMVEKLKKRKEGVEE